MGDKDRDVTMTDDDDDDRPKQLFVLGIELWNRPSAAVMVLIVLTMTDDGDEGRLRILHQNLNIC